MLALIGPLLAAVVIGQLQGGTIENTVIDDLGKPVAGAQVVFYAPPPWEGKVEPVVIPTKTDAEGRFRLTYPALGRVYTNGVHVWAYRPGSAIAAVWISRMTPGMALRKPEPRIVKIEGPDGKPVIGAKVSLRALSVFGGTTAQAPEVLTDPLAVTTGPDGQATIPYLMALDQLVAVRVVADPIGSQDLQLVDHPGRGAVQNPITIRLKKTSRLAGRIVSQAVQPIQPVANQAVEIWFKGGNWVVPNPVGFPGGPLRTAADGTFQTPDNLLIGSSYRVVVRAAGKEPILSDWITIGEPPRTLLPMRLRPLRTIDGRVLDRQGNPVAGVEVFQSGDGPEATATTTGADGRFALDGFRQGPVFLFVRGHGFRFHGQLIKAGERAVTVELTRSSERPARPMRRLPEPIPLEESRALARRLIEPYWNAAIAMKNRTAIMIAAGAMAPADPSGLLERLQAVEVPDETLRPAIQLRVVPALAHVDPEKAAAVAESIVNPAQRARALMGLVDALPDAERDRKRALLDRAAIAVRAVPNPSLRLLQMGRVAERRYDLGEVDQAKTLFAEGVKLAGQGISRTDRNRGLFAARLARVDLPSALAIARDFATGTPRLSIGVLQNIADSVASQDPAEAERALGQIPRRNEYWLRPGTVWKMAAVDPERARRLVEESRRDRDDPQMYLFLALGGRPRISRAFSLFDFARLL